MKEYIDRVYREIELPRNELRTKYAKSKDEEVGKILDEYEDAYFKSCLKIEEMIDIELADKDLNDKD